MKIHASELEKSTISGGVYAISGDDLFWIEKTVSFFIALLGRNSLSLHIFDSDVKDMHEVTGSLLNINFTGEPNVVIFRDNDFKWDKKTHEALGDILKENLEDNILLLVYSDLDAKEKKQVGLIECTKLAPYELSITASNFFKNGIDRCALNLLIDYTNGDLAKIRTESEKLSAYCGSRNVVEDDIKALVVEDASISVFNFINNITWGKNTLALRQLDKLIKRGEKSSVILAMIINQYRRILYAALSTKSDGELAVIMNTKEYAIKKARELKSLGVIRIKKTLEMLINYELRFKSGEMTENCALDCAISRLLTGEVV